MPFKSEAQRRLMLARAHGWKPKGKQRNKSLPSEAVAKRFVADSTGKARGGITLAYARGGTVRPGALLSGRPLPRPGKGDTGGRGGLGATARVGGLGDSARPRGGLAKRPAATGAGRGAALPGGGRVAPRGTGNGALRPRPGRGTNPLLAVAGTNHYQASDRLDGIRKRLR